MENEDKIVDLLTKYVDGQKRLIEEIVQMKNEIILLREEISSMNSNLITKR